MVRISWCGHSYFILEAGGSRIALDPHDGAGIGLGTCRVRADLVLVSHNHYDHNAVEVASGPGSVVLRWPGGGERRVGGVGLRVYDSYHDKAGGRLRGRNSIFLLEVEGLRIAFLGDLGHIIEPEGDYSDLEGVDVMMVPVGGVYTISPSEAWYIIDRFRPRIAIPMHYWVPGSTLPLDPLDRFLNISRAPRNRVEGSTVEVGPGGLPGRTTIYYFTEPPKP